MSSKLVISFARLLLISLCWSTPVSRAQETASKSQPEAVERLNTPYRLDYSINELEDGKKINTRQYSMNLNSGDGNSIKVGTRVPVEVKAGEFEYIDVGTNIWSRLRERDNGLLLEVRGDITSFAIPDQASRGVASMPLLRQLQINASTVALVGKAMIVGSVDDPNSKRQFQMEVTVTRLK
jgi:hypothetical protein